ncbi:MAG: DNA-binding protein [Candidatus Gribaldobacteria bacterium]|nr:DNA-binding protein [Candidatus Gribaldobacteria bacterium]
MESREQDNLIMARFFPEDDVLGGLKELALKYQIKAGVILSGIGQVKDVELGFFKAKGDYAPQTFKGNYELLSLSGNILEQLGKYEFHLHSVLGDAEKKVIGGHLLKAQVSVTLEVALLKTNLTVQRVVEESTGLAGMFFEK